MLGLLLLAVQDLVPVEDLGLRIRPGFKITQWADHTPANDLYSMTLDSKGRVLVSSQGWIRRLEDTDGDGRADRAVSVAESRSGSMGFCADGNDLLSSEAGGLWRHRDADGDGVMDGKPELLAKFVFGEHGHHALRKGPDGSWTLIGGNNTRLTKEHVTTSHPPIREPETGGLVRFSPDFKTSEVVAHGFRNPYDFDWNSRGDVFTYDSDCERDFFLPWYTPTRVYHVDPGQHHGWRLDGHMRSFARRDFWIDTVPMLAPIGRGSPTGVTVYRHGTFPAKYHDGLFVLDWTFGRVWFLALTPKGASYETRAEVFLEPSGSDGFAPTDLCVAPDGALLVSIGGRRTRGGVYRIVPESPLAPPPPKDALDAVLRAPQPLDAWSRARWEPQARALGAAPFQAVLEDGVRDLPSRIRAVEILVEVFGDLGRVPLPDDAVLRTRMYWALGRLAPADPRLGAALATEQDAAALRQLLEALLPRAAALGPDEARSLGRALAHPDRRVLRAAAQVAAKLHDVAWKEVPAVLGRALALVWRGHAAYALEDCLRLLEREASLDALRIAVLALGDYAIHKPAVEVHSMVAFANPVAETVAAPLLKAARALLPDPEAARVLALLEDPAPESAAALGALLTAKSHPTDDLQVLIVLSRLKAPSPASLLAHALLSLGRKSEGQEQRSKQAWSQRVAELTELFARRDPAFVDAVLEHPAFVQPGHVAIAAALPPAAREKAARLFLTAALKDPAFPWSEPLLRLIAPLPSTETLPALRAQWSNYGLRDSILLVLAQEPDAQDRDKFLGAVDAPNAQVARAALEALARLPKDGSKDSLVPLLRLLRRLTLELKESAKRRQVLALLSRESGRRFDVTEGPEPAAAYRPVFDAFTELKAELDAGGIDVATRLKGVPWEQGDVVRGAEVFRARGCQTCHAVQGALGPALAGTAARFSKEDLFEAIGNPSRDIAPPYRTTTYLMKDGQLHTGITAFESADGYILQTGATTTVRLASGDIAAQKPGTLSLMPNGLLDGLKPGDIADLYAYLRTLGK